MGLFEGADIVGAITAHERVVPLLLECPQHRLLILRRHARPDLDVLDLPQQGVIGIGL